MNTTIKKRIEEINSGRVPEGYEKTSFGIYPCDWIKVSLGEVSAKKGEYGLNAPACEYKEGLPKYLRITDIDDQGRYIDNNACVNDADSRKYVLNKGDIVFARTGASVGKNYIYDEKDGILVYAGFLIKFSIKPQYNAYLICSNCRTKKYDNWVAKMCARSGQPGINAEEYATYSFIIPKSAQEQSRIAEILTQWDKAIELQEKLIKSYQNLKKYYLSKMFPKKGSLYPEIRFAGFTEPWEERKLGDVVTVCSGKDYKHLREGNIPVYGTGGYMLSVSEALSYSNDAIGIGRKGTIDKPYILRAPFWTVDTLFYVVPKEKKALEFIYCLFRLIDWKSKDESTGVPSLSKVSIQSVEIALPDIAEQIKIGTMFSIIEEITIIYKYKLNKMIEQRKALQQYLLTGIVRV